MFRTCFVLLTVILLSACDVLPQSEPKTSPFEPYNGSSYDNGQMISVNKDNQAQPSTLSSSAQGKVAILLPLSGANSFLGQSMLNAAQMALFDVNDTGFELIPFDTHGTAQGASEAVRKAANMNVKLILGPLLGDSVQAAGATARQYNLQVIGFTTDATKVGRNISTLGILPYDQGRRLAQYAKKSNLNRVVIISPNTQYAHAVTSAFQNAANQYQLTVMDTITLANAQNASRIATALKQKEGQFDAIVMPIGNPLLATMAQSLNDNGLTPSKVAWLGAGLWDDDTITSNPVMRGAVYAAPTPEQRSNFERQYKAIYSEFPQRLASLAYDATALSMVLLRQNPHMIDHNAIMNPNGFSGIDGIFRFTPNGLAERGLAVHRIIGANRTSVVDAAPHSFVNQ